MTVQQTALQVAYEMDRATKYLPVKQTKRAVLVQVPDGIVTTIIPDWGGEQKLVGKWFGIYNPDTSEIQYGSGYAEFVATHEEVSDVENGWQKNTPVFAYQYDGEPATLVTYLADGTEETTNAVNPGDWLVRQLMGELMCVTDAKFRKLYEPAE